MSFRLTRSTSVDSAAHRPVIVDKNLSKLVTNLRTVHTAPALKPISSSEASPKFETLKFKNQYRESVATNIMSALNEDFKTAYDTGDSIQKRNLENVATAIYLAKVQLNNDGRDDQRFETLVGKWLDAINLGNQKRGCNFTAEQNFSVNRKNKERDAYQKAVNELGVFFKESFAGPKELAAVVMEDVKQRCSDILSHYGVDISSVSDYLQQAAYNAEKNMCQAIANSTSPGREGIAFLKQTTLHINSMLNYPNYLRTIISRADKPAEEHQTAPSQPERNAIPDESEKIPANSFGPGAPSASVPVVSLNNIGNPVINIDLGSKLDRLADNLEKMIAQGNKVYHIHHHHHIYHCQHVDGSSSMPHNAASLVNIVAHQAQSTDIADEPQLSPESRVTLTPHSEHDELLAVDSDDVPDANNVRNHVDEIIFGNVSIDGAENIFADTNEHEELDNTSLVGNTIPTEDSPTQEPQPVTATIRPMPPIDTFIAKQERVANFVTLSQSGLLRSNFIGASSAAMTRQMSSSMQPDSPSVQENAVKLPGNTTATTRDSENDRVFVSTASLSLHQRNRPLTFDNEPTNRQSLRHVGAHQPESIATQISRGQGNENVNGQILAESTETGRVRDLVTLFNDKTSDKAVFEPEALSAATRASQGPNKVRQTAAIVSEKPFSLYLDKDGNSKSPVTLTVDGLHRQKY